MSGTPRAVVTGIGVVSPVGIGAEAFSAALRAGRSGVRKIQAFDCRGFATQIAAEVDAGTYDFLQHVTPRKLGKTMSRAALFAVAAAALARANAGLGPEAVGASRLGVSIGVGGMGPVDLDMLALQALAVLDAANGRPGIGFDVPAFAEAYLRRTNPLVPLRGLPNLAAAHVAIQQGAQGPSLTVSTACASGTQALGEALGMIRSGKADVVLAGGTDAMVNPIGVLGFSMLGTLSRRNDDPQAASRPFDLDRDGFVIGEGAAMLVLEREEFARARGATLLAELAGASSTCDAYRITDERPDASRAIAAMRDCLEDADATPADVDYVNAHGTGTRMNDATEARAIHEVFGTRAGGRANPTAVLPVSSTKSMVGHMLGAAGAVEAAACVLAITGGFLPPTINCARPDPECDLDVVPHRARDCRVRACLSNSFGFGGQNACILVRRH